MLLLLAQATAEAEKGSSIWTLLLVVAIAGAVGGALNALISEGGVVLPQRLAAGGKSVWQPGWIGTVIAGIVAGAASWGLYGPAANAVLVGTKPATAENFALSLSAMFGALLVGFAGGRWLSSEADKRIAQANTAEAAAKANVSAERMAELASASPRQAAGVLKSLPS